MKAKTEQTILFAEEMAWAILHRRKTQVRRPATGFHRLSAWAQAHVAANPAAAWISSPYACDRLRVHVASDAPMPTASNPDEVWQPIPKPGKEEGLWYSPSLDYNALSEPGKVHGDFPSSAEPLVLRVTGVRLSRLQDTSPEDAMAEGMGGEGDPVQEYRRRWDESWQHEGEGWRTNPLVWVMTFEVPWCF